MCNDVIITDKDIEDIKKELAKIPPLSTYVNDMMKAKRITRKEFEINSALGHGTVSRIINGIDNGTDGHKKSYRTDDIRTIEAISWGLKCNQEECDRLLLSAFPELAVSRYARVQGWAPGQVNEVLDELKLELIPKKSRTKEEEN